MPVPCARCQTPLPQWELAAGPGAVCTACGAPNTVHVFPALLASGAPALPAVATEGEAACFDHPAKRAVASCGQCGRFVCQLCAIQFGAETLCPSCVASGRGQAKSIHSASSRVLYDSIALILPLASLVAWPLTVVTGPAAVVLSLMKWSQPLSLVRRFRWRFVLAILIGLAELGAWIWGIVYFVERAKMGNL